MADDDSKGEASLATRRVRWPRCGRRRV